MPHTELLENQLCSVLMWKHRTEHDSSTGDNGAHLTLHLCFTGLSSEWQDWTLQNVTCIDLKNVGTPNECIQLRFCKKSYEWSHSTLIPLNPHQICNFNLYKSWLKTWLLFLHLIVLGEMSLLAIVWAHLPTGVSCLFSVAKSEVFA